MSVYIWRQTIHGGCVLIDYWRSVLWKPPMTHIWHNILANRDIGNICDRRSNGTYNFVYLVIIILRRFVEERLINQRGVWDRGSEVRSEDWVMNG